MLHFCQVNFDSFSDIRQELPSRILDLKSELECLKQGVAEEKEQFLQLLEVEKSKLQEEGLNLNIKLAARNMAKERNKAGAIQEEVMMVDDELENGGGENCEEDNLPRPPSESKEVQVEAEGVEEEQVEELIRTGNVEENGDGQIVGEVDRP